MSIIGKLLEDYSEYEFEELKAEVAECTEYNNTTEALLLIADYYNLTDYIKYLTKFKEYQESPQYQGLTIDQSRERLDKQHEMFDILEKTIGEEKAKELYRCL